MKLHCIICDNVFGDIVTLGRHVKEKHKPKEKEPLFG
tara:strand:+ start:406 stop:516 length:111 start_codon:yes stop_codon:yes gene_type:complete